MQLTPEELSKLKEAFEFHDQGWTPWNEERELFLKAARAYLEEHREELNGKH
jgi:hypothetical protein